MLDFAARTRSATRGALGGEHRDLVPEAASVVGELQ